MAINFSDSARIPAPRSSVWEIIFDQDALRACIPGCGSLEQVGKNEFEATVVAKVGPIKARFKGGVSIENTEQPFSCILHGQGSGGVAGQASGQVNLRLDETGENETQLNYEIDAQIGGKIAQLGNRLVVGTVMKITAQFFSNMEEYVKQQRPAS
ncbi:MAG: carbon monoxide dehydrogenase subunit G [Rhizobiaceae bacterium]|nr:carbon monoxide dehydrogenase subunit G [Rhizobiaceae bacterium]